MRKKITMAIVHVIIFYAFISALRKLNINNIFSWDNFFNLIIILAYLSYLSLNVIAYFKNKNE